MYLVCFQLEDEQSVINAASSGSEDTSSLERNSSHGSDISLPRALPEREHRGLDRSTMAASGKTREPEKTLMSETEGEEMDNITEVSPHTVQSRSMVRSLSPSRRHSWEPGKHKGNNTEIGHRR